MALGDGITWDETTPTDGTVAVEIDDYNRDLRRGFRSRFAREHEMPASQAATSEGGAHKFITLQEQGAKPTVSGTQTSGLYDETANNLSFGKSDGTVIPIVVGTAVVGGAVIPTSGLALALTGTQFPAGTALLGLNVAIVSGSTAHGGIINMPAGYTAANGHAMVGLRTLGVWQEGLQTINCRFVTGGTFGTVHAQFMNDAAQVKNGSASYLAIFVK